MRKFTCLLLIITFFAGSMNLVYSASKPVVKIPIVKINNVAVKFPDVKPYLDKFGNLFVPVDIIVPALGGTVTKDDTGNTRIDYVTFKADNKLIKLGAHTIIHTPKTQSVNFDGKLIFINNSNRIASQVITSGKVKRLYMPLDFFVNYMGAKSLDISKDKITYTVQMDRANITSLIPEEIKTDKFFDVKAIVVPKKELIIKLDKNVIAFPKDKPIIYKNNVCVPLNVFAKAINMTVKYDNPTTATVNKGGLTIKLKIGNTSIVKNGKTIDDASTMAVAFKYGKENNFYVPLKWLCYQYGAFLVSMDSPTNTVNIEFKSPFEIVYPSNDILRKKYINTKIPKRLYDIPADSDIGKVDICKAHYRYMSLGNINGKATSTLLNEAMEFAKFSKSYVESMYNFNYRNVTNEYKENQLSFLSRTSTWSYNGKKNLTPEQYVNEYINDFKNNSIIEECMFSTDPSLVYIGVTGDYRVRGTLYFKFSEPSQQKMMWPGSIVGKWYQMDMEIDCYYNIDNKKCKMKEFYLDKSIPMEDKYIE